jgi:anti-anti-sigma factor
MSADCEVECLQIGSSIEVIRLHGTLDAQSAMVLLEHATRVRAGKRSLVLNLAGVTLIASSGLGALLATIEKFRNGPYSMRIAAPSPAVDSIIQLLNLHEFLPIDPEEKTAVATIEAAA